MEAYLVEVNSVETRSMTLWYLDSRASNHVLDDLSVFSSLQPSSGLRITGGQGHDVLGIGNVAIRLPNGEIQIINHVFYLLGIKKNLLLVGFLTNKNYKLEFYTSECCIKGNRGQILAVAVRDPKNGLYKLIGETITSCMETTTLHVCTKSIFSKAMLRHQSLGHFHYQGMKRMMDSGDVKGLPNLIISFSIPSMLRRKTNSSKNPKVSYSRNERYSTTSPQ